jgi:hypothetical protein
MKTFFFITAFLLVVLIRVNYYRHIKTLERDKIAAEIQLEMEKIKKDQEKIKQMYKKCETNSNVMELHNIKN